MVQTLLHTELVVRLPTRKYTGSFDEALLRRLTEFLPVLRDLFTSILGHATARIPLDLASLWSLVPHHVILFAAIHECRIDVQRAVPSINILFLVRID